MRRATKKLVLSKETVRTLQDAELAWVVGGQVGHQQVLLTVACPTGSCIFVMDGLVLNQHDHNDGQMGPGR